MLEDHRRKKGLFNNEIIERDNDKENISIFANKNESKSKDYKIYIDVALL